MEQKRGGKTIILKGGQTWPKGGCLKKEAGIPLRHMTRFTRKYFLRNLFENDY